MESKQTEKIMNMRDYDQNHMQICCTHTHTYIFMANPQFDYNFSRIFHSIISFFISRNYPLLFCTNVKNIYFYAEHLSI